jgi:hypothetical protein
MAMLATPVNPDNLKLFDQARELMWRTASSKKMSMPHGEFTFATVLTL